VNLTTGAKLFGQSVVFEFDQDVSSTLTADDLTITKVGDETFSTGALSLQYFNDTTTQKYVARFTFPNVAGGVRAGILPEGNYRATLSAGDVRWDGHAMAEDITVNFFFKSADPNRDRGTNIADLSIINSPINFNHTGKPYTQGNVNYDPDGNVNIQDYGYFNTIPFNSVLAPPSASSAEVAVSVLRMNEVLLGWVDDVDGESGWRVQMSEDGQNFNWMHNVGANEESYRVIGLQDGKRYWFRIRAYSDPTSNPNGPNTAYTPKRDATTPLWSPTDLNFTWDQETLELSWAAVPGTTATTAIIERSTDLYNWTSVEQTISDDDFVDSGLVKDQVYYYRVRFKNSIIESGSTFAVVVGV
jgi:hypothetical protein